MRDAATLITEIESDVSDLDNLSKAIDETSDEAADAEFAYLEALDTFVADLYDECARSKDKRFPGEDVRKSLAHRQLEPDVYREYFTKKRELEKLENLLRARRSSLNGRQSALGALRDEARASSGPQPSWSGERAA